MKFYLLEYGDSSFDNEYMGCTKEWFSSKTVAQKRRQKLIKEAETLGFSCAEPVKVDVPSRKQDLLYWLNSYCDSSSY